jgi:hypothetical protein
VAAPTVVAAGFFALAVLVFFFAAPGLAAVFLFAGRFFMEAHRTARVRERSTG